MAALFVERKYCRGPYGPDVTRIEINDKSKVSVFAFFQSTFDLGSYNVKKKHIIIVA